MKTYSSRLGVIRDKFYIVVMMSVIPKKSLDIEPGETQEEQMENFSKLIDFLSEHIEVDIANLSAADIVINKDADRVRDLMELIYEIVKAIIIEDDEEAEYSEDKEYSKTSNKEESKEQISQESSEFEVDDRNVSCPELKIGHESSLEASKSMK